MAGRWAVVIGVAAVGVMALGAQAHGGGAGGADEKQKLGNAVKVKTSCSDVRTDYGSKPLEGPEDEACTVRAEGKLRWVVHVPRCGHDCLVNGEGRKLKPASADLGPGETTTLKLKLRGNTRERVGEALDEGKTVTDRGPGRWLAAASVKLEATDAAGNVATSKRSIKIVE
jgi:hypothetical protein